MTKRIIVADDYDILRKNYVALMQMYAKDASISEVSNGNDLIEKVKANKNNGTSYDLIFTDIRMHPGITGIEATKLIREFDKETPIYVISLSFDKEYYEEALKVGATDFIPKNDMKKLEQVLKQYFA